MSLIWRKRLARQKRKIIDSWIIQYYDKVLAISLRLTGNREDAGDCTQDVFIKAWEKLGSFRGDSHPMAWLKRITINTCYNFLNRNKVKQWDAFEEISTSQEPVPGAQFRTFDPAYLRVLSPLERSVLVGRVYDELSFKALAAALDTTENSAKVSYHNAIGKLRKVMT